MSQNKISKLMEASDRMQKPTQERYEFAANKTPYLLMGGGMILLSLFLGYEFMGRGAAAGAQTSLFVYAIPGLVLVTGLVFILGSLLAKVILDEEGMSIPGIVPFMREKLAWDSIEKVEITAVIRSQHWLIGLVKRLLASFFVVVELYVVRNDMMSSSEPVEYAVLGCVQEKDRALVLRIVREQVGDRFTIY